MFVAAVLCLCAAVLTGALGVWALTRPPTIDYVRRVLRGVAPIQLAAAAMLGAGSVVGFTATPPASAVLLGLCVAGAVGTVGAGCWQSARAVAVAQARQASGSGCGDACASCTLSCPDRN